MIGKRLLQKTTPCTAQLIVADMTLPVAGLAINVIRLVVGQASSA